MGGSFVDDEPAAGTGIKGGGNGNDSNGVSIGVDDEDARFEVALADCEIRDCLLLEMDESYAGRITIVRLERPLSIDVGQ